MALPFTTTTMAVRAAGAVTLDAQRRRTRAPHGAARGPYGAVVSPLEATELPAEERDVAVQLRTVRVLLQPAAWPVTTGDQLEGPAGELWDVTGAVRRADVAQLDHVACTARRVSATP